MDAWTSFVSIKGEEPINVHQLTQYSLNNNECKTLTYDEAKKIFDLNSTKKKSNKKRNSIKKRHRRKRKSKIKNNIQSKSQSPTLNSTVYSHENSFSDMTDMTLNSIISGVTSVTNITNITSLTNMTHDKVAIERNTSADYYTNNNNNNNINIENNNNDNNNISNNNDNNINNNNISNGNSNNNSRKSINHNDDTQLKNKNNDDRKEFYQSIQVRKRTYDNIKDKRRYNPGLNPTTPTPIIRRISRLVNDDVNYRYNNNYAKKISLHDDDDEYSDSTLPRYNRYNSVPYVSSKSKKKANKRGTGNQLINLVTPAADDDYSDSDLSLVKAKLKKSGKSQPNKKNMKSKSNGAGSVGSSNGRRRHRSVSNLSSKHNSHALTKKNVIQLNSLTAIDDKNISTTDEDRDQFDAKMVVIDDHFKKGGKFPKSITKTQSDMYITFGLNDKGKRGHKKKHKKPSHKGMLFNNSDNILYISLNIYVIYTIYLYYRIKEF